jgi:hypothetical protein
MTGASTRRCRQAQGKVETLDATSEAPERMP